MAETEICVLNNSPSECPNRLKSSGSDIVDGLPAGAPVLNTPTRRASFPSSLSLTIDDADALKARKYCSLVGILGAPEAGKTAVLVALYLLLSSDRLDSFEYADSRTLMALEQISRGARRWNDGAMPDDLTNHTKAPDERTAGFLHVRLRRRASRETYDLLLPDLPGEWSSTLVNSNRTDRLGFLKSADVVWLVLDGQELRNRERRQRALHHAQLLMQRVATFLVDRVPPIVLVITRRDLGAPSVETVAALEAEAVKRGVQISIVSISSFSDDGEVPAGFGIDDLLLSSVGRRPSEGRPFWPDVETSTKSHRKILNLRAEGGV